MRRLFYILIMALLLSGCSGKGGDTPAPTPGTDTPDAAVTEPADADTSADETVETPETDAPVNAEIKTGFTENQTIDGDDGIIHFSYYLPEGYDPEIKYPLVVTMPGYDRMWFGDDSAGKNLTWNSVTTWTKASEPVIIVSGQLTDWGEKSARQANELAEYMIENFSVDTSRVYAAGYSAGGETMSRAVALRPDIYAAYIHGGSQWDGEYDSVAEKRVAVYIFMAEHDEYYGSQKARDAYSNLHAAYERTGLSDDEIDELLQLRIPDDKWFNDRGIYNYHGGGSVVFDDDDVINWTLGQMKTEEKQ